MSILLNIQKEQEKKALLAFLEGQRYSYQKNIENEEQINNAFLNQYNKEISVADSEMEAGNYVSHSDVESFLNKGEKLFNGIGLLISCYLILSKI